MGRRKTRVGIEEVAKKAGVSVTTVSFVLNNNPSISQKTRDRVWRVIHRLGYQPNINARNLSSRKTKTIAVVVPELTHIFEDPYFSYAISGIYDALENAGYRLLLKKASFEFARQKEYLNLFFRKEIDGIIYVGSTLRDFYLADFEKHPFPFIQINSKTYNCDLPYVSIDNYKIGQIQAQHLIDCGCQKIVYIAGAGETTSGIERLEGFLDTLVKNNYPIQTHTVISGGFAKVDGVRAVSELLLNKIDFDALGCSNDLVAMGALDVLEESKIKVPDEVQIVGADNIEHSRYTRPPLTTVNMPTYQISYRAAEKLIQHLEEEKPLSSEEFEPELIIRQSTRSLTSQKS